MGTGDKNNLFVMGNKTVHSLGHGHIGKPPFHYGNGFRILTCHGIADNNKIRNLFGIVTDIGRMKATKQSNPVIFKEIAHGRINILVRPCDNIPHFFKNTGQRPHAGTTGGDQVNPLN